MVKIFSNIEFEDMLIQYKYFIENIYNAYSCLNDLITLLNKFLKDYYKLKKFDEEFASELELKLTYFENYYQILDPIIDELDKFSLTDNRKKENTKISRANICIFYPKYYVEKDIYVPSDYRVDWDNIKKNL